MASSITQRCHSCKRSASGILLKTKKDSEEILTRTLYYTLKKTSCIYLGINIADYRYYVEKKNTKKLFLQGISRDLW